MKCTKMRGKMKKFLLCFLLVAVMAETGFSVYVWTEEKQAEERIEEFRKMRQMASLDQSEEEIEAVPVDFEELEKINPDIYAWITIPGTAIDTPLLQKEGDVSYYLSHSWNGEENKNGAVCSESKYNGQDFEDVHTVLYGNNCEDGSLFGGLEEFADEEFFKKHKLIAVYTPEAVRYYRIFAAYEYDGRHLLQSFDCEKPGEFKKYIESIFQQRNLYAQIDGACEISQEDKILTLSTGSSGNSAHTYLVQGVLEQIYLQ